MIMSRCLKKGSVENGAIAIMNKTNPLLLKGDDGEVLNFSSLSDMYLCLLRYWLTHFPRGYFEPSYFVSVYYGADNYKARDEVRSGFHKGGSRPWFVYVNWMNLSQSNIEELWKVIESIHKLLGTFCNYSEFLDAIRIFKKEVLNFLND